MRFPVQYCRGGSLNILFKERYSSASLLGSGLASELLSKSGDLGRGCFFVGISHGVFVDDALSDRLMVHANTAALLTVYGPSEVLLCLPEVFEFLLLFAYREHLVNFCLVGSVTSKSSIIMPTILGPSGIGSI